MSRSTFAIAGFILVAALLGIALVTTAPVHAETETVYQVSTIDALLAGVYEGSHTIAEVRQHGDLGLGTLDALDGEMIVLDGVVYQVKDNGSVVVVPDTMTTPFVAVTWFEADITREIARPVNLTGLQAQLDATFPSHNLFYAIRIDGFFSSVTARSVPAQEKPYPPLVEVVRNQSVFEYTDMQGTIVGFWSPEFVEGINVPGYHFHVISDDRTKGGHLLGCEIEHGVVEIDTTPNFLLNLPLEGDFPALDLGGEHGDEVAQVER
ncbi:MAG: acetolactate decarboxylase [Methanomicrobiaceae archaeon]|nr:acetolactate decarboxylase [Methanomicrobiaceae archaeon]